MPSRALVAQQKLPFIRIPPWALRQATLAETLESPIVAAEIYLSRNPEGQHGERKGEQEETHEQTKETIKPQRGGRTARG
jgi:hypothetical protein